MRKNIFILTSALLLFSFAHQPNAKKYILIRIVTKKIPGIDKMVKVSEISKSDVEKLNEPLKALAAYYSALRGNNCDGTHCELTSALGLGIQGSKKHKELIKKWFPNDKIAKTLIDDDCIQSSNGSSHFTDYESLVFKVNNDTITIDYKSIFYDHGKSKLETAQDKAVINNNQTITITRKSL